MVSRRTFESLMLQASVVLAVLGSAVVHAEQKTINRGLRVGASDPVDVYSSINGEVQLSEFAKADDVSTVNGPLTLHGHNSVQSLSSVNGNIIASDALLAKSTIRNVNGDIRLGRQLDAKEISTVHGRIELAGGKAEKLKSVTGGITVRNSQISQGIETVWGDISLRQTKVNTRIRVIKPRQSFGPLTQAKRAPRLIVGEGCEISGGIELEHPTQVFVHVDSPVPKISGQILGQVQRFSGATPRL